MSTPIAKRRVIHPLTRAVALAVSMIGLSSTVHAEATLASHHIRDVQTNGQAAAVGRLPASQVMQIDLVMPVPDRAAVQRFLADVYNPNSPNYRHFLTPAQFQQRFGVSATDHQALASYARAKGFTVVGGSPERRLVQVKGTVTTIENAFHVTMRTYQHPTENRQFYAPDREPTTDGSVKLMHITGLDNYSIPQPRLVKKNDFLATHPAAQAATTNATTGSGPSASFLGSDMRSAYYGSGPLTGAGQTLGLLEYYGTDLADLNTYFTNAGQTNTVPVTLFSTDQSSTNCLASSGCDDTEQTLDITQAIGMAPGLASLVMYIGNTDTAIISAMTVPTTASTYIGGVSGSGSVLPLTIGCSWGWTPVDPGTLDSYFETMAAQGQTFFVASGDHSTWGTSIKNGTEPWPADDANIVSVGGTDLVTTGPGGAWSSETAWVDSGGGISTNKIAIPLWQQLSGVITSTNKGSTVYRNGPDVAANANFTFYVCAQQTTCSANSYGGTSFAAPMWAAFTALANQQLTSTLSSNKPVGVGFINPTIYANNTTGTGSAAYGANFHDITSGTSGSYSATTGFDLVTGWGSPQAQLISTLVGVANTPSDSLSASAATVSVANVASGNATGTTTITSTVGGTFNQAVTLSVAPTTALPNGVNVTAALSTTSLSAPGSGSSTLTFTVPAGTPTGNYNFTVTATPASGTAVTTPVTLTVTPPSSFALSASTSSSITVAQGASGTVTIKDTVTGNFNSSVPLTTVGTLPSGISVSFSPSSVSGTTTSTATIKASSSAAIGTNAITISGTAGGITSTVPVSVTVTAAPTVTAATSSLTVGTSGTVTDAITVAGPWSGAVNLSYSVRATKGFSSTTGIKVSFSPSSVSSSGGTTTMTVTTTNAKASTSYTITITATGGTTKATTTVNLTT